MAEAEASSSMPATGEAAPVLTANLHIVSPNVGIGPLMFSALPASTTIRQLKEKIRKSLPSHPADDHQRLIHRGRLLASDDETLREIFTEEQVGFRLLGRALREIILIELVSASHRRSANASPSSKGCNRPSTRCADICAGNASTWPEPCAREYPRASKPDISSSTSSTSPPSSQWAPARCPRLSQPGDTPAGWCAGRNSSSYAQSPTAPSKHSAVDEFTSA